MKRPADVLMFIVDSLSAGVLGSARSDGLDPAPWVGQLAASGLHARAHRSHAGNTQFSMPSLMTSSLPLDHGGYEDGLARRPVVLAEVFRDAGYRTVGISGNPSTTAAWHYHRGLDVLHAPLSPLFYLRHVGKYALWLGERVREGIYGGEEAAAIIAGRARLGFGAVVDAASSAAAVEAVNPGATPACCEAILAGGLIEACRRWLERVSRDPVGAGGELLASMERCGPIRVALAARYPEELPDAARLLALAEAEVARTPADQPLFLWIHVMDPHERYWPAGGRLTPRALASRIDARRAAFIERVAALGDAYGTDLAYDLAVDQVDARLAWFTSRYGEAFGAGRGRPLTVVTADHGWSKLESAAGHPLDLGDVTLRVPLVIAGDGVPRRVIDRLSGHVDVMPTLLSAAGLPAPGGLSGVDLLGGEAATDRVHLAEHTGRSRCDPDRLTVRMAATCRGARLECRLEPGQAQPTIERGGVSRPDDRLIDAVRVRSATLRANSAAGVAA